MKKIPCYTEKDSSFGLTVCVGGHWDEDEEGKKVLRICLSMSTCTAKPHHWKHILLEQHHPLAQSCSFSHG